jgi:hypothetical protein
LRLGWAMRFEPALTGRGEPVAVRIWVSITFPGRQ